MHGFGVLPGHFKGVNWGAWSRVLNYFPVQAPHSTHAVPAAVSAGLLLGKVLEKQIS